MTIKASALNLPVHGIAIAALGIASCSGGGGESLTTKPSTTGSLSLAITDAPVDSVESIVVRVAGVRLKPQGGPAIEIPLLDAAGNEVTRDIDMLTLTDATYEELFGDAEVPADVYNWLELLVLADPSQPDDSHVVSNGALYELRIPSSEQNGLRFVSPFTVTADRKTQLLLDWDMRMALIQPPGQGGAYMLRPAFRLIDMTEHGTLSGEVLPGLIDAAGCPGDMQLGTGNAVYIYAAADLVGAGGEPLEPGDIGSTTDPAPVATGAVELDQSGAYTFAVILSPGDYRVAYTCAAEADGVDSDDDIMLILSPETVSIEHGETATVDFSSL